LRLCDNPALTQGNGSPVLPLFIWDEEDPYNPGGASQWWLYKSLASLRNSLKTHGLNLILRRGNPLQVLREIIEGHNVTGVYWNRCYDPYCVKRDAKIKEFFKGRVECRSFNASLLVEPWDLKTQAGTPYRVFTPYWEALKAMGTFPDPLPLPTDLKGLQTPVVSDDLDNWGLRPVSPDWSHGLEEAWAPGEEGGRECLSSFIGYSLKAYLQNRDFPEKEGSSKLSPYLHWGEISPRQIWRAVLNTFSSHCNESPWAFLREIGWREFAYYLLYHFPYLPEKPLQEKFTRFPWSQNRQALHTWQKGMTGYPIVDAGMRQLWQTGWMHNRVRMIAASFLVKDLLISWEEGAKWFFDTLVDADIASNSVNWQWVSGCGVDAAPYFRIFNPVLQGEKFDPEGVYVKRWLPELNLLSKPYIHKPWQAPSNILGQAGVKLGETYPLPMVCHKQARDYALEVFKGLPS